MTKQLDDILAQVIVTSERVKNIHDRDIPELKKKLDVVNGRTREHEVTLAEHKKDITSIRRSLTRHWQMILIILAGSSGAATGITKLLGLW